MSLCVYSYIRYAERPYWHIRAHRYRSPLPPQPTTASGACPSPHLAVRRHYTACAKKKEKWDGNRQSEMNASHSQTGVGIMVELENGKLRNKVFGELKSRRSNRKSFFLLLCFGWHLLLLRSLHVCGTTVTLSITTFLRRNLYTLNGLKHFFSSSILRTKSRMKYFHV